MSTQTRSELGADSRFWSLIVPRVVLAAFAQLRRVASTGNAKRLARRTSGRFWLVGVDGVAFAFAVAAYSMPCPAEWQEVPGNPGVCVVCSRLCGAASLYFPRRVHVP